MKRETSCLMAALLLSSGGIGWLLNENRSLREQLTGHHRTGEPSVSHAAAGEMKPPGSVEASKTPAAGKLRPDPSARSRFKEDRQRPTKREITPGGVSVVKIQDTTGASLRTEANLSVSEEQAHPKMVTVVQADSAAESLLKNSGFEDELAPWICENGKLVPDPDDPENTVLEVRLGDPGFRLSQSFRPAIGGHLTLSFRAKSLEPTKAQPTQLVLKLFSNGGKTQIYTSIVSTQKTDPSGALSIDLSSDIPLAPDLLMIENWKGKGELLLDDVKLEHQLKR